MKQYYYLHLTGKFTVVVARPDTDRIGLLGVEFENENPCMAYVESLNDREADRVDDS